MSSPLTFTVRWSTWVVGVGAGPSSALEGVVVEVAKHSVATIRFVLRAFNVKPPRDRPEPSNLTVPTRWRDGPVRRRRPG
jgi:hypothetical protein